MEARKHSWRYLHFRTFLPLAYLLYLANQSAASCDISQFSCGDGGCIPSSQFCDRIAQCRDYSDEPPGCTVCNRTYYGEIHRLYVLTLGGQTKNHPRRTSKLLENFEENGRVSDSWSERSHRVPFICALTFNAAGKNYGDLIQVTFSEFHVGRFNATSAEGGKIDGCTDDFVMIEEPGSVKRGGRWCGKGLGLNVYYSETKNVVITVKARGSPFGDYFGESFHFKLKFRFISHQDAIVRYGSFVQPKFRGELVRNTHCSRMFQGCRARNCKIQSPNFPGFYPRNITCYYLIKALDSPSADLIPVIVLSQSNDRLMQIGQREHPTRVSPEANLRLYDQCENPRDYVQVYDGGAMKSPLISKFCGTAQLNNITSSGREMLIVFHSAASGRMNHLPNLVAGFEFEAKIMFMKKGFHKSTAVSCKETIRSFGATNGAIHSPIFAMPKNSSCTYNFVGRRDEIVWLYFTKYHKETDRLPIEENTCINRLSIYEGETSNLTNSPSNLLDEFCNELAPPICIRSREKGFDASPCGQHESFLSHHSNMIVRQDFTYSTSTQPLNYIIYYEFVKVTSKYMLSNTSNCNEVISSTTSKSGHITSPSSVFFYGRGGKTKLHCNYKFISTSNEKIRVKLVNVRFPDRLCKTSYNIETKSYDCIARITGSGIIEVYEIFWNSTKISLGCICDNRLGQISFESYANEVNLNFIIKQMSWSQDYTDFFFEADYEFLPAQDCSHNRLLNGTNGIIVLGNSTEWEICESLPYKLVAQYNYHMYLSVHGYHSNSQRCQTDDRIVVYETEMGQPFKSICPDTESRERIDIFSSGWRSHLEWITDSPEQIIFKFLHNSRNQYVLKWLEVFREPRPSALESVKRGGLPERSRSTCQHECPEISACISATLWCDGVFHCPSGMDEAKTTCVYLSIPWMYVVLITVSLLALLFTSICILVGIKMYQKGKNKKKKKKEAQRLMTQEILLPMTFHKETLDSYYLRGGI